MKAPSQYKQGRRRARAVWLAMACVFFCASGWSAEEIPELKLGSRLERALAGGKTDEYRIQLVAGQFLDAVVEQEGIDVEVVLLGPDGKLIGHMDSMNSEWGPEPMVAIADASGEYRLRVIAGNPQVAPGKYKIHVDALRLATEEDKKHVAANRALDGSQDLIGQGTANSLETAAKTLRSAIDFYHSAGLNYDEAISLFTLGVVEAQRGDFNAALGNYELCLPIFHQLGDRPMEGNTLNNMAGAFDVFGDLTKAGETYSKALELQRLSGDRVSEAGTLNNIGKIHDDLAEWQEASEYYEQALPMFHDLGDRGHEGLVLLNLGRIDAAFGKTEKALEYYLRALPLLRTAGNKGGEAQALVDMAAAYEAEGDVAKALQLYEQAVGLNRSTGDKWREGVTLRFLGAANLAHGEPQKALEQVQESLKLLRAAEDRRGEGLALTTAGQVYRALHEPEQALAAFGQALPILEAVGDRNFTAQALMGMAEVERDDGRLTDARKCAEDALALVEQVRAKAGGQEDRASYFATQQQMGEFYIDLLMRLHKQDPAAGYDAEAFEAAERERARSLLEMLAEARVNIRQGVDPKLLQREHEIAGLLNSKAQRLMALHGADAEEKGSVLKKEIGDLESEAQQVELAIRKSSPQYSAITQPHPLTLKEIQEQVLDGETVLLEYALGEERSYLWAVTQAGLKSYELPRRGEIEKSVREVMELMNARGVSVAGEFQDQNDERIAKADAGLKQAAARLSQMVLAPAIAELGKKRLVLVTDGSLQHLPFAMLPAPRPGTPSSGTFLAEQHEIVSLPSASTIAELRKQVAGRQPAPGTVAVLADPVFQADDPRVIRKAQAGAVAKTVTNSADTSDEQVQAPRIPFTREEADRIIRLAGAKNSFEAVDFQASLATATSPTMGRYRYLHFATHGYLDSERPELSALVFSLVDKSGRPQPGFLRANEIYNLKLPAELVVLSACETGLGKEIRGEGIVGLTRGFMYAGAPRVIVSLWSVDDRATEELMAAFYKKLLVEKLTPTASLRQAQMAMAKNPHWAAPYYWAAFVQQGEWK
jgi:CHAT domain-containing protein/Tfp pilus assembly protein PilF